MTISGANIGLVWSGLSASFRCAGNRSWPAWRRFGFVRDRPWCGVDLAGAVLAAPPGCSSPSGRHGEHGLGVGEVGGEDHLDVAALNLGIDRCRAGVLAVDELRGPIGHDVAVEG